MLPLFGTKAGIAALTAGLMIVGLPLAPTLWGPADSPQGSPNGANKTSVTGASLEVMTTPVTEGSTSQVVELLSTTIKTSAPTDLVISVTAECALWTDVSVTGNAESSAVASVRVWVEVDGMPVPVSSDEPAGSDLGKVVFCNRAHRLLITEHDDEDSTYQSYLSSRSANAFNWIDINLGSDTHTVVVKAQLEAEVNGAGMAKAAVGKRTLVVEPMKLLNNAQI